MPAPERTPARGPVTDLLPIHARNPAHHDLRSPQRPAARYPQWIDKLPEGRGLHDPRRRQHHHRVPASSASSTSRPTRPSSGAGPAPRRAQPYRGPTASTSTTPTQPMEVYLEGNVILRQDQRNGPARATSGPSAPRGSTTTSSPTGSWPTTPRSTSSPRGCWQPFKVKSPRIEQFHQLIKQPDGTLKPSEHPQIRADHAGHDRQPIPRPRLQDHAASRSI